VAIADNTLGLTAQQAGLVRCQYCTALHRLPANAPCRRCGAQISSRKRNSLQRTWAFLIVGLMAYVPANLYPIMITRSFDGNTSDTIFTGVIALAQSGSLFVAIVVFVASVCIPVVAVLAALIQLGAILTIEPGTGINAFALSVVFTMFSATSLDPRLIWDGSSSGQ